MCCLAVGGRVKYMGKCFNTAGICVPEKNYMVDTSDRVERIITDYIEKGRYFTIHRARQYGKTTTLYILEKKLRKDYIVLSLSFEAADELFVSLYSLAAGLIRKIGRILKGQNIADAVYEAWRKPVSRDFPLDDLGERITELCRNSGKKIVLMIDEVDKSSDNQIFLSFLGLLREKYLDQLKEKDNTFQSVILAGVYDVKNLKLKLHPGTEPKYNSPWNIAVDFNVDMSFSVDDIAQMLEEYEKDYQTGMDVRFISKLIYDYTSGYPYLVSKLCQIADERLAGTEEFPDKISAWTREGISAAEMLLRKEPNTLFDDMIKKLADYPQLKKMLQDILFSGRSYPFDRDNTLTNLGVTFGFLKEKDGSVAVGNRIFETRMYDLFLSEMALESEMYKTGTIEKNQYIIGGMLQMDLVMKKFYQHFSEIYGDSDQMFIEEHGRRIFLLYLKPIINGTGNYYVESQTRDLRRTDVIVDYRGVQYVIELKIWRGEEYNRRGEKQLWEYLDYYGKDKGYLLSFNFNQNKKTGIQEIILNGKRIMEVVV